MAASGGTSCQEQRVEPIKLHKAPHRWPLVLIAIDKFVKATGLMIISFALSPGWYQAIKDWVNDAQTTPHNWLVRNALHAMEKGLGIETEHLLMVRICVIVYAGLYLIEGVGLFYERKWAEWMVVIGTAAFLPIEVYDFVHKPFNDHGQIRWGMIIIFALNLLMAFYLVWRLHRQNVIKRERAVLAAQQAMDIPPDPVKGSSRAE